MTKSKAVTRSAEWLVDMIDLDDVESLKAFNIWLRSGKRRRFACSVAQEAWAELLENSRKEKLH